MKSVLIVAFCITIPCAMSAFGQQAAKTPPVATPADIEQFEKKVRPLLVDNCVACHSGDHPQGGLRFDPIDAAFKGGAHGSAIVPGDPDKSLMIQAVRRARGIAAMPPSNHLSPEQVAILTDWVQRGAPIPAKKSATVVTKGFPLAQRRQFWSYRPVKRPVVPVVKNRQVIFNPIDAFLQAKREANGLTVAPPTDKNTLIRRVTYDLTGLPPTPQEVNAFLADKSPNAYEKVVDRLLASPHYGERWARHWLDLTRYAESLGHEFDFSIFNAHHYRDYVIRSFNADVPYDQFIREHLAGDLMSSPRRDPTSGVNESLLATGFFFLGEGKHSPVDVRQEQSDRIDNQIDVLGKTFLAQTLACARCHDHKFDPIPTRDYYALYGILKSSRYQQAFTTPDSVFKVAKEAISEQKRSYDRVALAARWRDNLASLDDTQLLKTLQDPKVNDALSKANGTPIAPLTKWVPSGPAFTSLSAPGDLILSGSMLPALIARPAANSARLSRAFQGVLRSPTFTIDKDFLHLRLAGQGGRISVVVDNFMMIRDPLYGVLGQGVDNPSLQWRTIDLKTWKGHEAYIELADSSVPIPGTVDYPVLPKEAYQPGNTWISLTDAVLSDTANPAARSLYHPGAPSDIRKILTETLDRWAQDRTTSMDVTGLTWWNELLQARLLNLSPLAEVTARVAKIEASIPAPERALAICDGTGRDERIFVRGSHKTPGDVAPRLQLASLFTEAAPMPAIAGSGRRELAERIASPTHPLTARVMVNRLWKHHFGTGIVASTDDFGHMGEKPSHPELLDWLASEFVGQGWSLKKMNRLIVLSNAYRMKSAATDVAAEKKDPRNIYLHRMPVRRLEAEQVRDGLLAVSGRLDSTLYGPSVHPYLMGQDGRGYPPTGSLDGDGRRTIYQEVRRNFPSLFLMAFDFPTPFTTIGRRTVSNVPAQSLTLMNSDFVWQQSEVWADRMLKTQKDASIETKIRFLYETAFARPPSIAERDVIQAYLNGKNDRTTWTEICHALYNAKEFIYVF